MDFDLNDDQRLLKESVERLIGDHYGFEKRKTYVAEPMGWSRAIWTRFAEMGLLGLPFAEAEGGIGGGPVETMLVMEALGKGLVVEPYFATVVLGGGLIRLGGTEAQRAALVPGIAGGAICVAFAHTEQQSRYALSDVETHARQEGGQWILEGAKSLVLNGDCAHRLIVSARVSGGRRDRDGIGLFLVAADSPGVSRQGYMTQDGQRAAEVKLEGVRVEREGVIGTPGQALPLIEQVVDLGIAALCAEAVGIMSVLLETTTEYMKTRVQFGQPIGKFQALQHRAADMFVQLELARSMALYAAMMAVEADPIERGKAVSAAKVQIGKSSRFIGQQSVQLHGGIGMTEEYMVGHYFRRLTAIDALFGNADHHLGRLAASSSLIAAD